MTSSAAQKVGSAKRYTILVLASAAARDLGRVSRAAVPAQLLFHPVSCPKIGVRFMDQLLSL